MNVTNERKPAKFIAKKKKKTSVRFKIEPFFFFWRRKFFLHQKIFALEKGKKKIQNKLERGCRKSMKFSKPEVKFPSPVMAETCSVGFKPSRILSF